MIEMTLSSRHRIRNSSPGSLRPSTLPLGHGGSPNTRGWGSNTRFGSLSGDKITGFVQAAVVGAGVEGAQRSVL